MVQTIYCGVPWSIP